MLPYIKKKQVTVIFQVTVQPSREADGGTMTAGDSTRPALTTVPP